MQDWIFKMCQIIKIKWDSQWCESFLSIVLTLELKMYLTLKEDRRSEEHNWILTLASFVSGKKSFHCLAQEMIKTTGNSFKGVLFPRTSKKYKLAFESRIIFLNCHTHPQQQVASRAISYSWLAAAKNHEEETRKLTSCAGGVVFFIRQCETGRFTKKEI